MKIGASTYSLSKAIKARSTRCHRRVRLTGGERRGAHRDRSPAGRFSFVDSPELVDTMAAKAADLGIAVPGIPHHVHLIAAPAAEQSLRLGIGEAHRRYSRHVDFREDWRVRRTAPWCESGPSELRVQPLGCSQTR